MTNDEFKELLNLKKYFETNNIELPTAGEKGKTLRILSNTTRDIFLLDTDRKSSITLTKKKVQERHANSNTMMIRLELDCVPHMYADGSKSSRNHIHIFDETCGNITYDLSGEYGKFISNVNDFSTVFTDFCNLCNIDLTNINIQGVM